MWGHCIVWVRNYGRGRRDGAEVGLQKPLDGKLEQLGGELDVGSDGEHCLF